MILPASYNKHLDLNLNNNPLSESIQVELSNEKLIDSLTILPNAQDNYWQLPEVYQMSQLRQLSVVNSPHPYTQALYNKIMSLKLFGYTHRNPFSAETVKINTNIAHSLREKKLYKPENYPGLAPTTAPSVLVSGESGTGKTTLIRSVLSKTPQAVQHSSYKGTPFNKKQLNWLSIDMPATGSPKALCANFFKAVDDVLGTEHKKEWVDKNKFGADVMFGAVQHVAMKHFLGLIHIDELQFILGYKKVEHSPSLQLLESLFNKIGIPVILSCTRQGVDLFQTLKEDDHRIGHDITIVRRMLSDRQFVIGLNKFDSKHFNTLFNALFPRAFILDTNTTRLEEFRSEFHRLSCGLPAIMTRLALLHHEAVQHDFNKVTDQSKGFTTLSPELLRVVYDQQFSLIDPALIALRKHNPEKFESLIRDIATKKPTYSNSEKLEAENIAKLQQSNPTKVLKTDDNSKGTVASVSSDLSSDEFLQGIGNDEQ
ncbi:ATP-binding protein [Psychrobium sp. 1_MG-2023]|uniref:ATP-binding protein n=1 Tax=Psychrobium sp. 1_MG-2023 TaxID=3062624 RepID=UPI000C345C7A|nr:ATP-binding protein [Psychrobium sp. 1_MG-2023]MDP2562965.1 ATP-binding protein [Psychrobium sp. 1_MG-2023]PKF53747.1 hypothetical protein CW748_17725 [Alteromonadales bacterium alter-6D02]